jgi:Na+/H+ antiporter NhaA
VRHRLHDGLFIGGLAFGDGSGRHALVRLGVLGGSVVSALLGTAVLLAAHSRGSHMR